MDNVNRVGFDAVLTTDATVDFFNGHDVPLLRPTANRLGKKLLFARIVTGGQQDSSVQTKFTNHARGGQDRQDFVLSNQHFLSTINRYNFKNRRNRNCRIQLRVSRIVFLGR